MVHNESRLKVWASTDVPFDLSLFDEMLYNLRLIFNRDAAYRSELEKIEGLQMRLEFNQGNILRGHRIFDETVLIEERVPPSEAFSPPPGYAEKERIEDFFM
jgi:hypothetical protein